ncbi:MAG: N-glycosylase/DNA lyase [Candidatus Bathyarchaeia archaeon]
MVRTAGETESAVKSLIGEVRRLVEDPRVRRLVEARVAEFKEAKKGDSSAWFTELVYCLLTAYSSAERAQSCVDALSEGGAIVDGGVGEVAETLRREGHRFSDRRAEYIVAARGLTGKLKRTIQSFKTSKEARAWLVENVKGMGWKEASHFLRNVGYLDVAILDRHILSTMREHGLIEDGGRRGLTGRRYLEYEGRLRRVAMGLGMPLGEVDLYLWYRKTGKILK